MQTTGFPYQPVLLVDDEPQLLRSASILLRSSGIGSVETLQDGREVMPFLAKHDVGVLVLDLTMPSVSGFELLDAVASTYPHIAVIIMTASDDLDSAIRCMRTGALDYLVKPVEKDRLVTAVGKAQEIRALHDEVDSLKQQLLTDELQHPEVFFEVVTQNKAMRSIFKYVEAIAASNQPVLITGETGTGKELFARAIHNLSGRCGLFVADNVAGLDDAVFSDTLFGHLKGAFTGADQPREGLISKAAEGTLFLDEIGDLNGSSQVKLLRLLQEGSYYPLGADQLKRSRARIVVATNRDIERRVRDAQFRKDLYYRLRAHHIRIPPLRDRKDDLPVLINHLLDRAAKSLNKAKPTPRPELLTLLKIHDFPGNVRELEGMIFDAVARHPGGVLSLKSFKDMIGISPASGMHSQSECEALQGRLDKLFEERFFPLKEMESLMINAAMRKASGNQGVAAAMLGITRQALNKRLSRARKKNDP